MTGHRGLCSKRCVRCREQANWLDWEKPAGRGLTQEPIVEREDFPALVIQLLRVLVLHSMPPVHTQLPLCHTLSLSHTHSFNHLNQRQWPEKTGNPSNLTDSQPHSHSCPDTSYELAATTASDPQSAAVVLTCRRQVGRCHPT